MPYKNNNSNIVFLFCSRFLKPYKKKLPNIGITMSILAISISIAILIIVTSVMNGFRDELVHKILGFNAHITLYDKFGGINNYNELQQKIQTQKDVVSAIPTINGSGMLINKNNGESTGIVIKGISKQNLKNRKELSKYIIGDLEKFRQYTIILGYDVAKNLGLKIGDDVTLVVPIVGNTIFGVIPRNIQLNIIGLLKTNAQQYDNYIALLPFSASQRIFNLQNKASSIEIITKDPNNISNITFDIFNKSNINNQLFYSDWQIENQALLNALKVESNVMSLILSLFIAISMFTIFAIIRMMIKSKEREIAILKSHGVSNIQINKIFILIGLTIAICGMIIGNIFGIIISLNIENIRLFLEKIFQTNLLDGSVYLLSNLPSKVMIKDIIYINIFSLFMATFCTLISTIKNTKINLVNVLRNN